MISVCCEQLRVRDAQLRNARRVMRDVARELRSLDLRFNLGARLASEADRLDAEADRKASAFSALKNPVKMVKPK